MRMRKRSLSVHAINVAENESNAAMRSRTLDRSIDTVERSNLCPNWTN
jgi:hypothetical protein